jgi:hypothetical protein
MNAEQEQHRTDLLAAVDGPAELDWVQITTAMWGPPDSHPRHRRPRWRPVVPAALDQPRADCPACRAHAHGDDCEGNGCLCRCRAILGLDGPFEFGDPTSPDVIDQMEAAG